MSQDNVTTLEPKWQKKIDEQGKAFSRGMEDAFMNNLRESDKFIPKSSSITESHRDDMRLWQLNTFIRYMTATVVGILMKVTGIEPEIEEACVKQMRDQFAFCRKLKEEGKL